MKLFLEDNCFTFIEAHPILVNRFTKDTTLIEPNLIKLMHKSLLCISPTVFYKNFTSKSYHNTHLKSLTKTIVSSLWIERDKLNNMTNVLDCMFPAFKSAINGKLYTASCLYTIEYYETPTKISRTTQETCKMISQLKRPISYDKFTQFKQLAKETTETENPVLYIQLFSSLQLFGNGESKIKKAEHL